MRSPSGDHIRGRYVHFREAIIALFVAVPPPDAIALAGSLRLQSRHFRRHDLVVQVLADIANMAKRHRIVGPFPMQDKVEPQVACSGQCLLEWYGYCVWLARPESDMDVWCSDLAVN